ncbi:beta-galactosidase [Cellvibrio zantedeschiae]|uniref:Beta-galactosidase n=1 Tax=Cellvibrio zantedeschiae TaxID=1237077 RepID=A0ABQ3ANX6_9GAMM|nr:beta-galactosidase GalA [Cellvibrio zantedeschiae]GGY63263.1 beta-galactosidase [Cellvibrio zantedeschiae]
MKTLSSRVASQLSAVVVGMLVLTANAAPDINRERLSLDRGWLFHLGDIPMPEIKGHGASYGNAKAGNAPGPAGTEYDDSDWRKLDLPHDWAVEGPFDPNANISQGYRPRGASWYRRYLRVDESERGRHFELQFDAIATHSTIWVNGNVVSHNWSGYNANYVDITPYLRYGDAMNTISIKADANPMEGWWYEGAGIYRHAWLVKSNPVHVVTDGVHAAPRKAAGDNNWEIPVEVTLDNSGKVAADVTVEVNVFDPSGKQVAKQRQGVSVPIFTPTVVKLPVAISNPAIWSLEQTNLYRVTTQVFSQGKKIDETSLNTGFRTIRFDAQQGFFLNDKHTKLQGVCIHQDHAGVGVAVPDSIWEYRLRRLKELGVNAIRFSHNAPASEVLDLVDRMGFVVMDENRNFNPSPDYMKQLEWMVRRDRHHPGIILWSVFNEEPVQGTEVGYEMVRRMSSAVKALDDTRPVTAAMNGGFFTDLNVSHAVDVLGANYQVPDYDRFHSARPDVPFTSSEDTSAFMTRGEYTTDKSKNLIASYDDDFALWGNSHRDAWQAIDTRAYVAGGFVWTGFDYRGEPTPNEWPSVSSVFGIMDLNGFAKDAYYIHQVQWIKDRPLVYIAPHWNWAGKQGQEIRVMVMANVERVKLLLNGRELGEQKVDNYRMNFFKVAYEPGKLEAIGYNGDKEVARASVETTGKAVALELIPDRKSLAGDGRDAMPITVRALDAKGRAVPIDNSEVTFEISGAGKSIGHGNGDPNSHEDEKGKTRKLFNGLAQLIVQSNFPELRGESKGEIKISARAPGLKTARVSIPVKAVAAVPYVAESIAPLTYLTDWRVSPASAERLNPTQVLADNDMNTWGWGQPPMMNMPGNIKDGKYRLYRTHFTPRKNLANGNGKIHFYSITGKAEIWLNGVMIAKKDKFASGELNLDLPAGEGRRQLNVLVEGEGDNKAGVDGNVVIEPKK